MGLIRLQFDSVSNFQLSDFQFTINTKPPANPGPQPGDDVQGLYVFTLFQHILCYHSQLGINEYAMFLHIHPLEPELFWIAREGLNAPLPPGWVLQFVFSLFIVPSQP